MYNNIQTKKRIDINLKFLKIYPKENLENLIKENDIYLNENAKMCNNYLKNYWRPPNAILIK